MAPCTRSAGPDRTGRCRNCGSAPGPSTSPRRRPAGGTLLLRQLKRRVDLSAALVIGDLRRRFTSVTAAAGAFGVDRFCDPDSLVLTGECKHHEALELLRRGVTAVALGHYASERPVLEIVRARLSAALPGIEVLIARSAGPPARPLHL